MQDDRQPPSRSFSRGRGFRAAGSLVQDRISQAGDRRGFSVTRLLTHWEDIVGADIARLCIPTKVGYRRKGGLGATLTLRVASAAAPLVQAQSETIRGRVNACYGYNAISQLRLDQSAEPAGFAEPAAAFAPAPASQPPVPPPEVTAAIADISDPTLRAALERLGARIHSRNSHS